MYSLDIAGLGDARIWIIGLFAPAECPDLLRGGMAAWNNGRAANKILIVMEDIECQ